MGCACSTTESAPSTQPLQLPRQPLQKEKKAGERLTDQQLELVTTSWEMFTKKACIRSGVLVYYNLFVLRPDLMVLFTDQKPPVTEESLLKNEHICDVLTSFIETMDLAVHNLKDPVYVRHLMVGVGQRHFVYGAQPEDLPLMEQCLVQAMEKRLGSDFTEPMRQAWHAVFPILIKFMTEGIMAKQEILSSIKGSSTCVNF